MSAALVLPPHTLFEQFPKEVTEAALKSASLLDVGVGQRVRRSEKPDTLYIVLEGEVALIDRRTKARVGAVVAGRTLELGALLSKQAQWAYEWVSESGARLIVIEASVLSAAFAKAPAVEKYLARITSQKVLRKLKDDLRFLGFSNSEIRATINACELRSVATSFEGVATPHLALLQAGDAEMHASIAGEDRVLSRFTVGDYIRAGQGPEIIITVEQGTQAWMLAESTWAELVSAARVRQFVAFADPLKTSVSSLRQRTQRQLQKTKAPIEAEAEQEEDTDDADDDLGVFSVTKSQLKALHGRKRPIILQHDEMDCGAACLSMVAQFHGKKLTLPTLRGMVNVTRDGSSLLDLKIAAEALGFIAEGIMTEIDGLADTIVPMIALMEYHFIVIYEVAAAHVLVGDPALGLTKIPREHFEREWSKMVLLLKPTPKLAEFPDSAPAFEKYAPLLGGIKTTIFEVAAAAIFGFILGLAPPLFMQLLFDGLLVKHDASALNAAALAMAGLIVLTTSIDWVRQYLTMHLSTRLDAKFASTYLGHTLRLPLSFFAVRRVGDITRRTQEIDVLRSFIASGSVSMLLSVVSAVLYSVLIAVYSWKMLALVLIVVPLLLLFIRVVSPIMQQNLQAMFKADARAQSLAYEHFGAIETIKTLSANVSARWRWELSLDRRIELQRAMGKLSALIGTVSALIMQAVSLIVLIASVKLYMDQELTLGKVVAVNTLVGLVIGPLIALASQWTGIREVLFALEKLDDVMTATPEPDPKTEVALQKLRGEVSFTNVGFRYGGDFSPQVLSDVSLKIRAGETVAFVGRSGSGKTTMGYMINLLYAPTEGAIALDGTDAKELPLSFVRRHVGMIVQDNNTFSGTVMENIALGEPYPSFARVLKAAQSADAHEFISKLPQGYATKLGESGSGLSGGQRQRLNIARALYRDPAILIMDEATSALDAVAEEIVMKSIKAAARRRTTIIIAHRLNTILWADRIFVFDEGKLAEFGTHEELMRKQEVYFDLFSKQLETV